MTDGSRPQGGEGNTDAGPKPSIAEVAAWLRRAAEQRDSIEDLRPAPRPAAPEGPPAAGWNRRLGGTAVADEDPADRLPDPPLDEPVEASAEAEQVRIEKPDAGEEPEPEPDEAGPEAGSGVPGAADVVDEAPAVLALVEAPSDDQDPDPDQVHDQVEDPPTAEVAVVEDPPTAEVPVVELPPEDEAAEVSAPAPDEVQAADEPPTDPAPVDEAEAPEPPSLWAAPPEEPSDDLPSSEVRHPDEAAAAPFDLVTLDEEAEPPGADRWGNGAPEARVAETAGVVVPSGLDEGAPGEDAPHRPDTPEGDQADQGRGEATPDAEATTGADGPGEPAADEGVAPAEPDVPRVEALVEDHLEVAAEPDGGTPGGPGEGSPRLAPAPGLQGLSAGGSSVASLFDLDLAELASRARTSAEARMASIAAPPSPFDHTADPDVHPEPSPGIGDSEGRSSTLVAPPDPVVDPPLDHRRTLEPTDSSLDFTRGEEHGSGAVVDEVELDQERDGDLDDGDLDDGDLDEVTDGGPRKAAAGSSVAASAGSVLRSRRAKRKRYPRGQLREKIGLLRRVRAMLGVVVLTVVLGVAAGAAIGAFLLFLAFAIRGAITSS